MSARPVGAWLMGIAGAAVLATVVAAIAVIGPPSQQREQRFDERRVQALMQIEGAVATHAEARGRLPESLDALRTSPHGAGVSTADPQTGHPYGYRPLDTRRYELCADFATAQQDASGRPVFMGGAWAHPAGRHCFEREVTRLPGGAAAAVE